MKVKYIILLLIAFAINAQAQNNNVLGLSYSMGFGVGETSDYIGRPALSGFAIEGHKFLKPNVSVGLLGGWNIFNEKSNSTVNIGNVALSGEQGRYLNVFPVLANASFYIKNKDSKFVPFIRAHVGTYYIMQRFDIGVYSFNNYNWHFGIAPELGFNITASKEIDVLINARYNYAFDSGSRLNGDEDNSYSFFTLNFGITYRNW